MSKNCHLKLICFASVSSVLFLSSCGLWCQQTLILSWFALLLSLLCFFCLLVGLGVKNLKLVCFVSVSSVLFLSSCGPWGQKTLILSWFASSVLFLSSCGPWCQQNSHLKLICLVSVSSVLFRSSCGPWCQKTLILSWFAVFLSLLCSFCLLVGLGVKKLPSLCVCLFCAFSVFLLALVSINCLFCALSVFLWALVSKNSHLKLGCFVSASSVLFLSSCGPWCQKTVILS